MSPTATPNPYEPPPPGADDAAPETERQLSPNQMHYIGFWRRLGARAIDSAVMVVPTLALLALLNYLILDDPVLRQTVMGMVGSVLGVLYFIVLQGWRGQTLGKLATRIQVRLTDGAAFTYSAAVWRHSPELVLSALMIVLNHYGLGVVTYGEGAQDQENASQWLIWVWYLAEVIVLATNAKKRAIHDFIAGTVVVRKPGRRPAVIAATADSDALAALASRPEDAEFEEAGSEEASDDDPLDDRVLCPDGDCVGVIGQDGLCKACGKPADWQPT